MLHESTNLPTEGQPTNDVGITFDEVLPVFDKVFSIIYNRFNVRELKEDIYNGLFLSLLQTKYLERFDKSRSIHTYLFGFILNYFRKIYNEETVRRRIVVNTDLLIPDLFEGRKGATLFSSEISEALKELNNLNYTTSVVYFRNKYVKVIDRQDEIYWEDNFIVIQRSYPVIFMLLILGWNQKNIRDLLKVSKSFISRQVKNLAEMQIIRETFNKRRL